MVAIGKVLIPPITKNLKRSNKKLKKYPNSSKVVVPVLLCEGSGKPVFFDICSDILSCFGTFTVLINKSLEIN